VARQVFGLNLVPAALSEAQRELQWLLPATPQGSKALLRAHVHCLCTAP
jgi:hypothetical protein